MKWKAAGGSGIQRSEDKTTLAVGGRLQNALCLPQGYWTN